MPEPIGETLLEMHYFSVLREHFASILGLPNLRILKPTPRREKWLGFDQAFVKSSQTGLPLERSLREFIHSRRRPLSVFRAVFLQFKVVEYRATRRGAPADWVSPWYCSHLSMDRDPDTKISQHETLVRLSQLPEAAVAYACPMLFDSDDILLPADLTTLRLVDVRSAPEGWLTEGGHKIAFQTPNSDPYWCSDPEPAKELDLRRQLPSLPKLDEAGLFRFISTVRRTIWRLHGPSGDRHEMPSSLFILAD